jgi:hypothetical protein
MSAQGHSSNTTDCGLGCKPDRHGYEVCRQLKADPVSQAIPVIFLTARHEIDDETRGLALGAVDYIAKPISPPILLARVKTHLAMKRVRDFLRDENAFLEAEVSRRPREIELILDVTVQTLASLAEIRNNETGAIFAGPGITSGCWPRNCAVIRASPRCSALTAPLTFCSNPLPCTISARSAFPTVFCSSPAN